MEGSPRRNNTAPHPPPLPLDSHPMTLPIATLALWLAVAAYLSLSWHFIAHARGKPVIPRCVRNEHALIGLALAGHFVSFIAQSENGLLSFGVGHALSMVMWLTVLMYWTASFFYSLEGLQAFLMPMAVIGLLAAWWLPPAHALYNLQQPTVLLHIVVSLAAYSLLLVAATLAMLMAVLDHALHAKHFSPLIRQLPPLLSLEKLLFQVLGVGFVLLTLTVFSGAFFSEHLFGKPFTLSHKTVFSLAAWGIFAGLLWGRVRHGWRGRLAIRWTLTGFGFLLLSYMGSKVVLELLLGR